MDEDANVLEQIKGLRVLVEVDTSPHEPYDDGSSPLLRWELRGAAAEQVQRTSYELPDTIIAAAERWGRGGLLERYLRIFHGARSFAHYVSDDFAYMTFDTAAWREAMGLADDVQDAANLDEWRAYCEGEVFGWVLQRRVIWRKDGDPATTLTTWEDVDSCWGYYGRDHVEREAREALEASAAEEPVDLTDLTAKERAALEWLVHKTAREAAQTAIDTGAGVDFLVGQGLSLPEISKTVAEMTADGAESEPEPKGPPTILFDPDGDKTAAYLAARLIETQETRRSRVEQGGVELSDVLPEHIARGLQLVQIGPEEPAIYDTTSRALVRIVTSSFSVEVLHRAEVPGATACGTCGRVWDDTITTAYTPVPAGRCPFEYYH